MAGGAHVAGESLTLFGKKAKNYWQVVADDKEFEICYTFIVPKWT